MLPLPPLWPTKSTPTAPGASRWGQDRLNFELGRSKPTTNVQPHISVRISVLFVLATEPWCMFSYKIQTSTAAIFERNVRTQACFFFVFFFFFFLFFFLFFVACVGLCAVCAAHNGKQARRRGEVKQRERAGTFTQLPPSASASHLNLHPASHSHIEPSRRCSSLSLSVCASPPCLILVLYPQTFKEHPEVRNVCLAWFGLVWFLLVV